MIKVYIASAYSLGDKYKNVEDSLKVADQLMDLGFAPFAPLLTHFQDQLFPRPYQDWLDVDLAWMEKADVVLRLKNGQSLGADTEEHVAKKLGIPVVYSIEELLIHLKYLTPQENL